MIKIDLKTSVFALKMVLGSIVLLASTSERNYSHTTPNVGSEFLTKHYQELSALAPKLDSGVLNIALKAYFEANEQNNNIKKSILTVIDYSLPSSEKRLWVFDLTTDKLLYNTHVAHGARSGKGPMATHFSNEKSSKKSSIGVFRTGARYTGKNGPSLRLHGLDKGFNDNALARGVVMHGAWYVNPKIAKSTGRVGNSSGCLAVSKQDIIPLIKLIKDGSFVLSYFPDPKWLDNSPYLNGALS